MPLFGGFAQARNFGKGGAGKPPGFITPAGSIGSWTNDDPAPTFLTVAAAVGPGDPPIQSYSIVAGGLPPGLSFNTTTAAITGTPNTVTSNTTYTFTVQATSAAGSIQRQFSIDINTPSIAAFTSVTTTTWTSPVTKNVEVVVIGGGGSGGNIGGGGGGGGVAYATSYPVVAGQSYDVRVGGGGAAFQGSYPRGNVGTPSYFGPTSARITGNGGGHGGGYSSPHSGGAGGSGGGGAHQQNAPGPANQPGQPTTYSTTNYGNRGAVGQGTSTSTHQGGGGGGAAQVGFDHGPGGAKGGNGVYLAKFSSYGTPGGHFAAGGGGSGWSSHAPSGAGPGGTGGGGRGGWGPGGPWTTACTGHGSGSGGGGHPSPGGQTGGVGAVFIRY